MPSGVWPLEGFHSHNHLLCISNIPSQAATLLHDQTTVRNCLCSKTRPKAQKNAQTKVSKHTQSYICRQKLRHVQRNCTGVMNSPVIQHKSIPVIACLQGSIHPAAFPPSASKLKLHSKYTAAEWPQLLLHQCKQNCPSLLTNMQDALGYVCLNISIGTSVYAIKSLAMCCNTSPALTGFFSRNIRNIYQ